MAWYIFEYRELITNLVISDLKVKYASSVLGFAWSMLNPLIDVAGTFFRVQQVLSNTQETLLFIYL